VVQETTVQEITTEEIDLHEKTEEDITEDQGKIDLIEIVHPERIDLLEIQRIATEIEKEETVVETSIEMEETTEIEITEKAEITEIEITETEKEDQEHLYLYQPLHHTLLLLEIFPMKQQKKNWHDFLSENARSQEFAFCLTSKLIVQKDLDTLSLMI